MKCNPAILELQRWSDAACQKLKMQSEIAKRPVTCSKGCVACCDEPVYALAQEVDHILGRLTPRRRKEIAERTRAWLAKVEPSGLLAESHPSVFTYRALKATCPFLEGNLCSIYHDRPFSCRVHMAVGPAADCFDEEKRRRQLYAMSPEIERQFSLIALRALKTVRYDNLGVLLAQCLLGYQGNSASAMQITAEL